MVFLEKLFFQAKKSLEKPKTSSFIHYLIFDFYRTVFVSWSAGLCNCHIDLTTDKNKAF